MTVHKTAYETTACRDFAMKKTLDALLAARSMGHLPAAADSRAGVDHGPVSQQVRVLEGGASIAEAVPSFAHPVLIPGHHGDDKSCIVVDVRQFGRWDPHQMQFQVRNHIDYNFAILRAALDEIWNTQSPTLLRDINQQPLAIFASWLSESIAQRFSLDPGEQYRLSILAAIFYNSLFVDGDQHDELSEQDKARAAGAISRALRAKAEDVLEILDKDSVIPDTANFCMACKEILGTVRLADLNAGVVFAIVGGTWFGPNAREVVAVALEHPPTWLAILITALNERTYKNSRISKLTERFVGKKDDQLVPALLNLIRLHAQ